MIRDFMNPHKISANSDHKQKSFNPKKIGVLLFETVKILIFSIVTRVSTRDYTVSYLLTYGPNTVTRIYKVRYNG